MAARIKIIRFTAGFLGVLVLLTASFAAVIPWCHTYGATPAEVLQNYPGDEILSRPNLVWTHGVSIQAPAEKVWPWIAQISDSRAAFYSFTFIENMISGYSLYHNADTIHPEWQNPQPGQGLIADIMKIKTVEQGKYLLGEMEVPGLGWTWLWEVVPQDSQASRLLMRMRIQSTGSANNPMITNIIDLGGFVMEKGMLQGIQDRAEGRIPPPYFEAASILFWLIAALAGFGAAWRFMVQRNWLKPLAIGVAVIPILFLFTFIQPVLWVRLLLDIILLAGLWWAWGPALKKELVKPVLPK
jgi:hypothetical protein